MPLGGPTSRCRLNDYTVGNCVVERMSKVSYANAVGSLMYLTVCTRPDIAYAVSVVSRYLTNLGKNHWEAVKWILKYLWGTTNVGLVYGTNHGNHVDVTGFVDSDYAKDPDKEVGIWPYGGCEGSYLAKETLGRVRQEVLKAKTVKSSKGGYEHNAADLPCEYLILYVYKIPYTSDINRDDVFKKQSQDSRRCFDYCLVFPTSFGGFLHLASSMQLVVVVLVAALAPEFVLGFTPLESGQSQLDLQSALLGLQLVSAQVHVESVVVQLESALVHLAIQTI
ncbi:hypothetical protein Tco_0814422 [Tanacetum coccineum]